MANDVIIKFRSYLPGAGYNRSGSAKQGKTNVRGRIEVTSYTRGGEPLTPTELGLNNIDDLTLTVEEPLTGNSPRQGLRAAGYSHSAQEFYVYTTQVDGDIDEAAGASTLDITFDAFGDAAHDVELT